MDALKILQHSAVGKNRRQKSVHQYEREDKIETKVANEERREESQVNNALNRQSIQ